MRDLDINSKIMFGVFYEVPTIAPVGINASYPRESNDKHGYQSVCGFGVMDIGPSGGCFHNVAVLVSYYVALHTLDLLVAVNSLLGTRQCGS